MQNSPFGSVLMLSLVILFYSTGAIVSYLAFILSSYTVWPVYEVLPGVTAAKVAEYAGYGVEIGVWIMGAPGGMIGGLFGGLIGSLVGAVRFLQGK